MNSCLVRIIPHSTYFVNTWKENKLKFSTYFLPTAAITTDIFPTDKKRTYGYNTHPKRTLAFATLSAAARITCNTYRSIRIGMNTYSPGTHPQETKKGTAAKAIPSLLYIAVYAARLTGESPHSVPPGIRIRCRKQKRGTTQPDHSSVYANSFRTAAQTLSTSHQTNAAWDRSPVKQKKRRAWVPSCGWAIKDSNLGPTGYEPGALTN